jgi:hypothetical protein
MLRRHEYLIVNSIKHVLMFGVVIFLRRCLIPFPDLLMNLERVICSKPARLRRLALYDVIFDQKVETKFRLPLVTYFKRGYSR